MKKSKHRLTRGLVLLLAASLPRTSDAGSVSATWHGVTTETYDIFVNGVDTYPYSSVYPDTLTMEWTSSPFGYVDFNVGLYVPFIPTFVGDPFGPHSATFGGEVSAGGQGNFTQDFNLTTTYSYIDAQGTILGGSATADFTYVGVVNPDPLNYVTIAVFESFQSTVPEPPTIVTMGLGLLTALDRRPAAGRTHPGVPGPASRRNVGRLSRGPSWARRARSAGGIGCKTDFGHPRSRSGCFLGPSSLVPAPRAARLR